MKKIVFACSIVLFFHSLSFAKFDPSFTWTTLETPHFLIHFHQDGEEIARKAAGIAEDVHARLVPRIRWEPEEKTEIVLVDAMDEANGMASPIPYNRIILLLTQPVGAPGFGSTPYEDWMRMVITHEYTHILQMDMVKGGYGKLMQTLFGRSFLSFPNALQPIWLMEGLATYEETEQTSGGRGRSAGADMILRMATLEGPFPLLSQMTVFPDTWPSGQVPYLFGESFTRFIAGKYGREKLADLSVNYSGRGFPFLVNSTAKRSLGSYYGKLYHEWKANLRERYGKQREQVKAGGMTASTALTRKGYETYAPALSPDGTSIAYLEANGDEFPGIYIMDADGGNDHRLTDNVFPSSAAGMTPAWSREGGRLYYTKLEFVRNTNLYNDIYYYDLKKQREVRLTEGLRSRDPDPSPDGARLVFVTNRMGMTRLALLDISSRRRPAGQKEVIFLTEESGMQYETPRWSPDGLKIAVGVWQPGGYKDIWVLDSGGKKLREVTNDRAIDGSPAWSPDGKYLYFSSDRTGIYNLFAYEFDTGKLFRVTNVLGGAFSPCSSRDNKKLVFTDYSARGYDIHSVDIEQAAWKAAAPYQDAYPAVEYEDRTFETSTRPYSPLRTLAPTFWLPFVGYSSESGLLGGFLTFGQDVVQKHQYFVTGLYGPKNNRAWYGIDYLYDGLYPTVHLHASDQDQVYGNLLKDQLDEDDYTEKQRTYGLELIVPLLKMQKQHALRLGYRWREVSALSELPPWPMYSGPNPVEGVLASGRVSYLFNSAKRYNFSISPEQGRTLELGYERLDRAIGSDFDLNKYTADWHEYINLPWQHHVLQARAFAGRAIGQDFPQGAFQLGGDMPGDITLSIDDWDVYLRGYPVAEFRGQKAALASLEYRFPVVNIEHGGGQTPFFLRRLHGAVFAEAGNAWNEGVFHAGDVKRAVGAELRLDLDMVYGMLPVTLRLGFARGLDEEGESQVIMNAWVPLGI